MQPSLSRIAIGVLIAGLLAAVGCGPSSVLSDIDLAVDASAAAAPIIIAADSNIPAAEKPTLVSWVTSVNSGLGCAVNAVDTLTTNSAVASAVLGCVAGLEVPPTLVPGTPSTIISIVQALAADIKTLVDKYTPAPSAVAAPSSISVSSSFFAPKKPIKGKWTPSSADKAKIAKMKAKVAQTAAKLKK